jgi:putative oxidoreductase
MGDSKGLDYGFLVLRISLASIFVLHGWTKFFGEEISFFQEMLRMAGWEIPALVLLLVALLEFGGGLLLMIGLLTRVAAALLACEMLIAVGLFHLRQGFFIVAVPSVPLAYGFEYHVALIGGLVALALTGSGCWAVERKLSAFR